MDRRPESRPETAQKSAVEPRTTAGSNTRAAPTDTAPGARTLRRCLLVVDQSTPSRDLLQLVTERCGRQSEVHVLVSRHRRSVLVPDPILAAGSRTRARAEIRVDDQLFHVSEARLACFVRALAQVGVTASGEIASRSPLRAARRAMRSSTFDEVLVVEPTRPWPAERSAWTARTPARSASAHRSVSALRSAIAWLRRDLAGRLGRGCPVPITRLFQSAVVAPLPVTDSSVVGVPVATAVAATAV